MKAIDVILKPVISEKATMLAEKFIYLFYVNKQSTRIDVKNAMKELYGADVAEVKILNTPSKTRVMKKSTVDKRPSMKKAVITLKGKKKLDVTKMAKDSK